MTSPIWMQFSQPEVRNLAWCILSPSLASIPTHDINLVKIDSDDAVIEWLKQLDNNPQAINKWMNEFASVRLGHRFEHYWRFYWAARGNHLDQLFNTQINTPQRTLGELDALLYSAEETVDHYELAIKFYLGYQVPNSSDTLWMGPNTNDRLDLKLKQMQTKQLTLLDRDKSAIPCHWNYHSISKNLIMKGLLFYPLKDNLKLDRADALTPKPPHYSGAGHQKSWWLRGAEIQEIGNSSILTKVNTWCLLTRQEWFAPIQIDSASDRIIPKQALFDQIEAHFESATHPLMIASMCPSTRKLKKHTEQERIMLVHNQWPA